MKIPIEVYEVPPKGFAPKVEVAACYLEIDNKLLMLQLPEGSREVGCWGVPAGKVEQGESPLEAAKRELFEETGIAIDSFNQVCALGTIYMRRPQVDYVYHLFKINLDAMPDVCISDEHQNYTWASLKDLEELPMMSGAEEGLQYYRNLKSVLNPGCYSEHGWQ